jgi:hypothetical protein
MTTVGGGRERTCGRAPSLAALREGSRKTEEGNLVPGIFSHQRLWKGQERKGDTRSFARVMNWVSFGVISEAGGGWHSFLILWCGYL